MATITVLGSGNVGRTLAGKLDEAGHKVIVGSRDPRRAAAEWAGGAIRVTDLPDAAGSAEVVINATPGSVSLDVLTALSAQLTGKVLVDIANATESDSAGFASALRYPGSSLAEEIQRALPDVRVVKTLNTMHDSVMADPARLSTPLTVFMSGNDAGAKKVVGGLLAELGWPQEWIIDLGDVKSARAPEAFVLMVGGLVRALGPVPFGMAIAR